MESTSSELPITPDKNEKPAVDQNRTEINQRDIIDGHMDLKSGDIVTTNGGNEYEVKSYEPGKDEVIVEFKSPDGKPGKEFTIPITDENISKFERPE